MCLKQFKIQIVHTDYQKTRTYTNSIPLNVINGNEQMNIIINIKFSTSHHITKSTVWGVNFTLFIALDLYLKMYPDTHCHHTHT